MKHGLCSSVLVAEDPELIQERTKDLFYSLKPQNEFQGWLVDKMAVYTLRIDRAERMERRYRDRRSLRAEALWDDDQFLEIEKLGGKIGVRPAEVVEELRRSTVGCDWLISRWSLLANAADRDKTWTPAQVTLAFNLLGTPFEFREGRQPGDIVDGQGLVVETNTSQAEIARREIGHLEALRERVADLDEVDQALTQVDLFDEANPELKRLRRYESALFHRLQWCLREMRYESPHFKPNPELTMRMITNPNAPKSDEPAPSKAPEPTSKPKGAYDNWQVNAIHPPFDIEPHEVPKDGSRADLFQVLLTRQEKREKRAESRREAKRRKAEKLRA